MRHPLCLYWANTKESFFPDVYPQSDRFQLIANNPVACARFFDFMVRMFIKHILGIGTDHDGIFGKANGYYGTVEEQGRLTLHLHLLLWTKDALTPQQIEHVQYIFELSYKMQLGCYQLVIGHCSQGGHILRY